MWHIVKLIIFQLTIHVDSVEIWFLCDKALILPRAQLMVFEISLLHKLLPQDRKTGLAAFKKNDLYVLRLV